MTNGAVSAELMNLLKQAIGREIHVSVQYMLQHAIGAGQALTLPAKTPQAQQTKFIASHSWYMLPGATLKKVAITEMRHAEAISERVVLLGGEPPTQPTPLVLGKTPKEMLENDSEEEREAIELYRQIIAFAEREHDAVTAGLFRTILADEQKHLAMFLRLLGAD